MANVVTIIGADDQVDPRELAMLSPHMTVVTHIDGIPLRGRFFRVRKRGGRIVVAYKPWAHEPDCACDVTHTFTCANCGRRVGWCLGGFDELPDDCNFCWFAKIGSRGCHDRS
jgi:hypothetical protein